MTRLHRSQASMAGQRQGGIGGAEQDGESYDDFLDLNGCYFIYAFVRDPGRARELESRKVTELMRKERAGTVTLTKFSGNRALETGVGGGFLTVASG